MKQPCVYILASSTRGTLYIGVTGDLVQRLDEHRHDSFLASPAATACTGSCGMSCIPTSLRPSIARRASSAGIACGSFG
ncbi:MAG TPA: GIY-YIG nuclease family protein [Xanthomonadales bacterium]|nr:GIY-YIG nuclease family protein [Xanthomonadales bacterium]